MRTETLDFDLHGIVGIRLLNATPDDVAAVKKQLGPIQKPLLRAPDIVIRFLDQIPLSSPMRYLGVDDVGFTDDAFFVFRSKHQTSVKVQIPFDQIGNQRCEIVCQSGLLAVPLLIPILNLTAMNKGVLPLHASALLYNGKGILITGWSKGGKTETLLAFAANGAKYIGDEWIYLSGDGQRMYGIPEPTRIWYWHLQMMPRFRAMASSRDLFRLTILSVLVRVLERLEQSGTEHRSASAQLVRRSTRLLKRQLYVQLPPEEMFGQKSGEVDASLDQVFFVASHNQTDIIIRQINSQEVAQRIVFSLQEERMDFLSYYWKYRFAFPECSNLLIDQAEEIQRNMLMKALAGKQAYAVYHPYPFSIPSLFEAMRPYCSE